MTDRNKRAYKTIVHETGHLFALILRDGCLKDYVKIEVYDKGNVHGGNTYHKNVYDESVIVGGWTAEKLLSSATDNKLLIRYKNGYDNGLLRELYIAKHNGNTGEYRTFTEFKKRSLSECERLLTNHIHKMFCCVELLYSTIERRLQSFERPYEVTFNNDCLSEALQAAGMIDENKDIIV